MNDKMEKFLKEVAEIEEFNDSVFLLDSAIKLAGLAHADDKWGDYPYLVHLALVADEVGNPWSLGLEQDEMQKLAYLHDVIEDHPEYYDLVERMFPDLMEPILMVSRRDDESYNEYIDRLIDIDFDDDKFDPKYMNRLMALYVKLCDLNVNLGNNPPESLAKRYVQAKNKINNVFDKLVDFIQNR